MSGFPRRAAARVAEWSRIEARPRHAYAVAALLGLVAFLVIFGPGHLLGTSVHWDLPLQDSRAYLMGYRYFLHEDWHWPVFVTHGMNVPYAKSIAFTDSIPLWALANKTVATIIPPWGTFTERAYIGLWYGVVWALQPCLGLACLRVLGHRSWFATIATALFFLAVPAWLMRYVHASLSAHFLLLWAFYLYLRGSRDGWSRRLRILQLVQLATAAMINPYQALFSYGFLAASVLQPRRLRELAWAPLGLVAIGAAAWFSGYFASEAKLAVGGFDQASANALTMFIPRRGGLVGESLWIDPTGYQYEGVAYLGAGLLVLLVVVLARPATVSQAMRRHPFLFALALGAFLFSLSNHIFVGPYELASFDIPNSLTWVAEQFRCPGRFVWIPMYVLIVFVLHQAFTRLSTGWRRWAIAGLALVQLVDATGDYRVQRANTEVPRPEYIATKAWRPLVRAHRAVFILPSYDCVLDGTPDVDQVSLDIQYLASERAIPINGVYSARPTRDCRTDAARLWSITPDDGALYVLLRRLESTAERLTALGATCAAFAYGRVCSRNAPAIEAAIRASGLTADPHIAAPVLLKGAELKLDASAPPEAVPMGWSFAETWGRWTDGPGARLVFRFEGEAPAYPRLGLAVASPLCGARTAQAVDVSLNAVPLGTLHFDLEHNDIHLPRLLPIPDPAMLRAPVLVVDFLPRDYRRPAEIGCHADGRELGVSVEKVWIE
jgi:hypothetical protein